MDFLQMLGTENLANVLLQTTIRSAASVAAMFLLAKLVGVRQIAQLTFYDYISGITIGSLAAVAALDDRISLLSCLLSMLLIAVSCYLSAYLTEKSIRMRRVLTGTPIVLIDNGNLVQKNLSKSRYDVNDVLRECRCAGYFDIQQISCAMLEANGKISILPKGEHASPTNGDLSLNVPDEPLPANVIIDGRVMRENLAMMRRPEAYLREKLAEQQLEISDILLGTLDHTGMFKWYVKGHESDLHRILT